MKETAKEYYERVIKENKANYSTANDLLDEMISLCKRVKDNGTSEDLKWELGTAISEAWHVVLLVNKDDKAQRLVNTIAGFLKNYGPVL